MTETQSIVLICGAVFLTVFITVTSIIDRKRNIKKYGSIKNMIEEETNAALEREPRIELFEAKVLETSCFLDTVGIKPPKTVRRFVVTFQKENGEIFNQRISEEYYQAFETGMKGKLKLVDGELYSFEAE